MGRTLSWGRDGHCAVLDSIQAKRKGGESQLVGAPRAAYLRRKAKSPLDPAPWIRNQRPTQETQVLKEFKEFAIKGNMLDMAVGIIIGAAFGTVMSSFVADLMMPLVSGLVGLPDFSQLFMVLKEGTPAGPYTTVEAAVAAGAVTLNWGAFINHLIAFLMVALALFMVIKGYNKVKAEMEAEAAPEAPPGPSETDLLAEIRDLLAKR